MQISSEYHPDDQATFAGEIWAPEKDLEKIRQMKLFIYHDDGGILFEISNHNSKHTGAMLEECGFRLQLIAMVEERNGGINVQGILTEWSAAFRNTAHCMSWKESHGEDFRFKSSQEGFSMPMLRANNSGNFDHKEFKGDLFF